MCFCAFDPKQINFVTDSNNIIKMELIAGLYMQKGRYVNQVIHPCVSQTFICGTTVSRAKQAHGTICSLLEMI
jgi:hypothetical protein